MTDSSLDSARLSFKMAALRAVDLPLHVYHSLAQVHLSAGTKKLVAWTAAGAVSLLLLARHFQRRKKKGRRKKNAPSPPWDQTGLQLLSLVHLEKDNGGRQNLTLSLSSKNGYSCGLQPTVTMETNRTVTMETNRKLSGSLQSLTSVKSSNSSTCANGSSCWDRPGDDDICNVVNIPVTMVTTPENLYLMGMDLFSSAVRRWEQALMFRPDDEGSEVSLGAGDAIAMETEDIISAEFILKLESLLQRAYRLQEEFEGALGAEPCSHSNSNNDKNPDASSAREDLDEPCLRDTTSIASTDSFVSAAELSEQRAQRSSYALRTLERPPFYEEALRLAEDRQVSCRVLRTEVLECLGDTDFLAKLHCVRQACQLILCETATRTFLADTGKKILSSIIVKACKSPKRFEEVFEEMILFLDQTEHWANTEVELATRGVKHLNFYDIVLDFILMDSFEDLENPPVSIQNVVNNRWLNSSFKETAVASSCWSVLKQKRQHVKVPDGFIAHFYTVCEQISPVLAWGFLGPKSSLHDFCCFFKDQVLFFLKDIFDLEKVRYVSLETLAEDTLRLLRRRSELLVAYLGADALRQLNGSPQLQLVPVGAQGQ